MVDPFTLSGLFDHNSLDRSISNSRVSDLFLLLLCFIEFAVYNANILDPDKLPLSAAYDLGLH